MGMLERSYPEDPGPVERAIETAKMILRSLDVPPRYVASLLDARRVRDRLDDVEIYAFFVGYPRSGHSLVGSLLNAHPDAVICHELDVTRYLKAGFGRDQLYAMILRRDEWFEQRNRQWSSYSYRVPGQWQGKVRRLRVIGDKKGGGTTRRLRREPELLDKLRDRLREPCRAIHVLRDPYDQIASTAQRGGLPLEDCADRFFRLAETVQWIRDELEENLLDLSLFDLTRDTEGELARVLDFLGLEPDDGYLRACDEIVFESPHRRRDEVDWPNGLVEEIRDRASEYPFLQEAIQNRIEAEATP